MKRKLVYGLLAVLISFGLWMYVVTVVNPEWEDTFYNIPVVLENEDILMERGLMLVSDEKPTVTLRLSGNRTDMIKLNSSNITIKADLSRIYSAGEQSLNYSIIYPGDVPNNAFKIVSQTPQQLSLKIVEWKSKEVDVQVDFMGTAVPQQYISFKDKATLDYEKITVTGPVDEIDRIAYAKIQVDLSNQTETISSLYEYILCDADGNAIKSESVKTNTDKIQYTLKIQQWKDITLRVEIVNGGGVKQEDCTITQSLTTIRVSGSEKLLVGLEGELLLGTINLGLIENNQILSFDIPAMPEGITNLTESSTVEVDIKLPNFLTKGISVKEIVAKNNTGMEVTFITNEKTVKLRGLPNYVNLITADDLKIVVDFTGAEAGMGDFRAEIVISEEFADYVGAVGTYDVKADVKLMNG